MSGIVHTNNPVSYTGHPTHAYTWYDTYNGVSAAETEVIASNASSDPTPAANRISNVPLFPSALYELCVVAEGTNNTNGVRVRMPSTGKAVLVAGRGSDAYRFRTPSNLDPTGGQRLGVDNTVGGISTGQIQVTLKRLL